MTELQLDVRARLGTLELDVKLLARGAPIALIGPNGSGKSTLLRLLTGALSGATQRLDFRLGERLLDSSKDRLHVPIERRGIGYVPQHGGLFSHLTALQNVLFGSTTTFSNSNAGKQQSALELLTALECLELKSRLPRTLSGGERQKIALARALFVSPALLLLDEPLSALDARTRRRVRGFLARTLEERPCPCIIVTHDARDVLALGAEVHVLEQGRIVQSGSLAQLKEQPRTDFVAEFTEAIEVLRERDRTSG
jgi:ABC-type sulfate/molybdate transport systems ATPase subunit